MTAKLGGLDWRVFGKQSAEAVIRSYLTLSPVADHMWKFKKPQIP
jgi:hypothetical protein